MTGKNYRSFNYSEFLDTRNPKPRIILKESEVEKLNRFSDLNEENVETGRKFELFVVVPVSTFYINWIGVL